ncbi:hypothetical protein SIAM614_20800 [Stappia aggregata IAM 12614]|uniref:Uncharacterized protein n=1 Tax=Roseibium aggregatum (strain ATCC 25650 / DSM 13394 / JCM 20685 / NBRC 16684 / NCIMB 2208 / IAM 12614 / B1) TaxID=384765 RepID=A0NYH1_ROSAI|nr:hypothetical protein SIAM614_20800 [Stappia aggregata IAM 12614] [Roseibium aggregatum IAM 12614]
MDFDEQSLVWGFWGCGKAKLLKAGHVRFLLMAVRHDTSRYKLFRISPQYRARDGI